jgi:endonuclease YncB( thermonuclease family)
MRVLFATLLSMAIATAVVAEPIERKRIDLVDGDGVHVDGVLMRILGCDTPETSDTGAQCDAERGIVQH